MIIVRRHIFKKVISIVIEGYAVDDTIEFLIRPTNSEVEVTNLCVERADNGNSNTDGNASCRKIFLYVDQDRLGAVTLDILNANDIDTIDINANIKFYAR